MEKIICTVTNDLSYDQRMIRICTSLSQAGYQVELVGRKRAASIPLKEQAFQQKRLKCFFEQGKWFYLEYNIRLFFYLFFSRFDIICAVDLDTILPGLYASRLKRKVCVYDAHEYFTEVPEVIRRPNIKKIWEWVARRSIPKVPYCYTVGDCLATIFEERYGPKFEVIRNVPFPQENLAQASDPPVILYQGALNEGRGLEQAILAMQHVEGAQLWLAGEGDLSKDLRSLTERLKLKHKVRFLGYLQPEDLRKVTLQASIGLNLLENKGLSYYYSLANKAFDYIQAGIPSLSMDFPEYRSLNEQFHTFLLLPNLETSTIRAAIERLLTDEALYQSLQQNCLEAKKVLHWEAEERKLIAFYRKLSS